MKRFFKNLCARLQRAQLERAQLKVAHDLHRIEYPYETPEYVNQLIKGAKSNAKIS